MWPVLYSFVMSTLRLGGQMNVSKKASHNYDIILALIGRLLLVNSEWFSAYLIQDYIRTVEH